MQQKIVTNLWFDNQAAEAAEFYCSVFKNSRITGTTHYPEGSGPAGQVLTVEWELDGQRFVGINGGPQFKFSEAISLSISCEDQDEVDYYWEKLIEGGGVESMCGWLKDRFGLSWQVVPEGMEELFSDADPERAQRAFDAMQKMRKLDIAALRSAADGVPAP
jgi:predicted 3-demethylubiquinone-9 3-methyltransferase (glyoxalase superfamily)